MRLGSALCALVLLSAGCAPERPPAEPKARVPRTSHARTERTLPRGSARRSTDAPHAEEPPATGSELSTRYGSRAPVAVLHGEASYYGDSLAGHRTANGERYDPRAFTAAHRTLPFGTILRVVCVDTGAVTYVRVTDRGPFGAARRILDLSRAAAEDLHMIRRGVANVRAEILEYGPRRKRR